MILRHLALPLCALLLCAADYPDPPPALVPYIEDGRLQPGDYAWIEGSFADASPGKKAEFLAIQDWADQCLDAGKAEARVTLAAAGFPTASLDGVDIGPLACRRFSTHVHELRLAKQALINPAVRLSATWPPTRHMPSPAPTAPRSACGGGRRIAGCWARPPCW